ncbi:MAG: YkvA family protein [Akkermansiaceae bacterium]|nr:YkvA family protein [Akkermansiaceae bacterium]MDP4647668.1 YkvA family protein [Akkermansiaceae bacterium]MDP4780313.1 YkvA family protein [Akkermansiaceae bacterium]MDP4846203.1 YkvA family protein [Akkermansiaceae bacterium]MDP4898606.1 YkvA family protein [Akkermansiaceae bacterium]
MKFLVLEANVILTMKLPDFTKIDFKTHFPEAFTVPGFWRVVRKVASRGGRKLLGGALTLFFCLRDSETPAWAKSVILGALGYLIFPMDFIPDTILGVGFTDDWSVIIGAITTVAAHIKDDHRARASAVVKRFFGGGEETKAVVNPLQLPQV